MDYGPNGVGKSTIFNIIIGLLTELWFNIYRSENITTEPIFIGLKNIKLLRSTTWWIF